MINKRRPRKKVRRSPFSFHRILYTLTPFLILAFGIFLIDLSLPTFLKIDLLSIKDISISINNKLKDSDFIDLEKISKSLDSNKGIPIYSLEKGRIINQLKQNPWIKNVTIRKIFPSKLKIQIDVFEPIFIYNDVNLYYLSKCGKLIDTIYSDIRLDLPVISGFSKLELKNNRSIISSLNKIENFFINEGYKVSEIFMDRYKDLNFVFNGERFVVRLSFNNYKDEFEKFKAIIKDAKGKGILYKEIDLSFKDIGIVKRI